MALSHVMQYLTTLFRDRYESRSAEILADAADALEGIRDPDILLPQIFTVWQAHGIAENPHVWPNETVLKRLFGKSI
jgi:hypothetical protein